MDEDGRLRTVYLSISSRRQRTEICSQTVHLMDKFGRWTKIIILRWMSKRIFDDGPLKYKNVDGGGRVDR